MRRFFAKKTLSAFDMNKLKDPNKKKFSHREHRGHRDLSAEALAKAEMNYKQCKSVLLVRRSPYLSGRRWNPCLFHYVRRP
jgi:hypothetical protein